MSTAQVEIDSIAAGGDGIGRIGELVVFVPRSAPGDVLTVALAGKKRFARGTILSVASASNDRVTPPCRHYQRDKCGGCQIQHLSYTAQLRAKATIIRDGVSRIGKRAVEPPSVEASTAEWRYRAKLTLAIRHDSQGWRFGLHPFDDPVAVFQLDDCLIADERVVAAWRQIFSNATLLPLGAERGSVRVTDEGTTAVVIEGGTSWEASRALFEAVPAIGSLWWKGANRPRELVATRGGRSDTDASFSQVNVVMGERLHEYVLERVYGHRPATAVDAYAGTGRTAISMARSGISVTAIELDARAAESCAARLPAGSVALTGRVEDLLPRALPADVVLLNPPRTGLADSVPRALNAAAPRPRAIVYISCNPATLGRDLARLPGYRIESIRGFDMFPQTAHVETVCELVPEAA